MLRRLNLEAVRPGLRVLLMLALFLGAAHAAGATFRIATLAPDGSSWMRIMRDGAARVADRTDKRVKFKFYAGGVMGDDHAALRKIRAGQLQGAAVTAGVLSSAFSDAQIYSMPMVFRSNDEVDYVRSQMDGMIEAGLRAAGFVTFGLAEAGFAYAMSTEPATSLAESRTQKVWIPANDEFSNQAMIAFGLNPVPMPIANVLAGLQGGMFDAVGSPPIAALALQWHTQLRYILDLPLLYIYGYLAVDARRFERLSAADQQVVDEVMRGAFQEINAYNRKDDAAAMGALVRQGLQLLTPDGQAEWAEASAVAAARMVDKGVVTAAGWEQLNRHIVAFRQKSSQGTAAPPPGSAISGPAAPQ